ncbi:uncharacterized protein TNCV_436561 [Trichonephila clavipes]|nr:uncharacterized protein TNCV_436561 [Trichonephila clavipes]
MPRSQKVFKKRKGKYHPRKNTINRKTVAVDGTWQKRGYTSLNGIVTVTSIKTGKEIDVDILSKYCTCKNLPFHEKDCKRNYVGSSGSMGIQGASKVFQRSLSLHNARYITYLGDGDCKALDAVKVKQKNIYGNEYPIEKLECIDHIMKCMGTRLRRLKAQLKGQILSDGKCLSGKNRLTEHEIDNMQSYYGSAIRRNHSGVQNMRQAIWAIFLHKLSTDEYPHMVFVPSGKIHGVNLKRLKHQDEVEKLAYQLNEEAERTERPIRGLSKVMYGSTCADMQVDVMGECLSSIKHVVGTTSGCFTRGRIIGKLEEGRSVTSVAAELEFLTASFHDFEDNFKLQEQLSGGSVVVVHEETHPQMTDESRFSLSSDSHRILIWRERGSCNHPSNIIERDRGAMGLQFLFMDNNAPCHRTVAAEQLLESEDTERMDWPARSPDLNPIEHVWEFLGRRLAARTLPPVTIRELRLALQDEWAAMPQQLIDTLNLSMGRRCETCLAVRGYHIPY